MIDDKTINDIVQIIIDNILTPMIYMFEDSEAVEFICFMDLNTSDEDISMTEQLIHSKYGINCEIIDIRQFSGSDRIEILEYAELVYSVDDTVLMIMQNAIYAECEQQYTFKRTLLDRKKTTGTYFLS